jgi:hypothetical protein
MDDVPGWPDERAVLHRAVNDAQEITGLQFCVMFCLGEGRLADQADDEFGRLGIVERPDVLVLVDPMSSGIDIVLGVRARGRVDRDDCSGAVAEIGSMIADGELGRGLARLIECLAETAGDGEPGTRQRVSVPDVIVTVEQ